MFATSNAVCSSGWPLAPRLRSRWRASRVPTGSSGHRAHSQTSTYNRPTRCCSCCSGSAATARNCSRSGSQSRSSSPCSPMPVPGSIAPCISRRRARARHSRQATAAHRSLGAAAELGAEWRVNEQVALSADLRWIDLAATRACCAAANRWWPPTPCAGSVAGLAIPLSGALTLPTRVTRTVPGSSEPGAVLVSLTTPAPRSRRTSPEPDPAGTPHALVQRHRDRASVPALDHVGRRTARVWRRLRTTPPPRRARLRAHRVRTRTRRPRSAAGRRTRATGRPRARSSFATSSSVR